MREGELERSWLGRTKKKKNAAVIEKTGIHDWPFPI